MEDLNFKNIIFFNIIYMILKKLFFFVIFYFFLLISSIDFKWDKCDFKIIDFSKIFIFRGNNFIKKSVFLFFKVVDKLVFKWIFFLCPFDFEFINLLIFHHDFIGDKFIIFKLTVLQVNICIRATRLCFLTCNIYILI